MLALEALPALVFLALLFPIPESPRWLIQAGREMEARQTLNRIGGPAYADEEVAAVNEVLKQEKGSFSELFSKNYRLPLVIAVFIMFASQFSGINVIMYYSTDIFMRGSKPIDAFNHSAEKAEKAVDMAKGREKLDAAIQSIQSPALQGKLDVTQVRAVTIALQEAKSATSLEVLRAGAARARRLVTDSELGKSMAEISSSAGKTAFTCSVWLGLVNVLATFIAILFIDKLGRKPLLLAGNLIQVVGLVGVGFLFYTSSVTVGSLLGLVIVYILAFAMAMGPIPWVLCSEIFPAKMRGRAMSVATFSIWLACFIVVQTSPALMRLSPAAAFFLYGACSLATFLFVLFVIPETKGKSLEEIEKSWQRHDG